MEFMAFKMYTSSSLALFHAAFNGRFMSMCRNLWDVSLKTIKFIGFNLISKYDTVMILTYLDPDLLIHICGLFSGLDRFLRIG